MPDPEAWLVPIVSALIGAVGGWTVSRQETHRSASRTVAVAAEDLLSELAAFIDVASEVDVNALSRAFRMTPLGPEALEAKMRELRIALSRLRPYRVTFPAAEVRERLMSTVEDAEHALDTLSDLHWALLAQVST